MSDIEVESKQKIYYESIGKKFLSGKNLTDEEKNSIVEVAVRYASSLVDERKVNLQDLSKKPQHVRDHLDMIVLDRVVSFYQSGSTTMFEDLKKTVCDAFSIKEERLSDEKLHSFLSSGLDEYFENDISSEVEDNMNFIRATVQRVVPTKP